MFKWRKPAPPQRPNNVELNREILKLLFDKRQLGSEAIQELLPTRAPTEVMNALATLKDIKLVEAHKLAPPHDFHILTANGERSVRASMGQDVAALERSATIAMLEAASKRPVSHAVTLPDVGPAIVRGIFGHLSRWNRYLEPYTPRIKESDATLYLAGRILLGVPPIPTPPYSGHVTTYKGREHLKKLKAQL